MNEKEQMLTTILNCRRDELYINKISLTKSQESVLSDMEKRRKSGEPLQYILGNSDFMGLTLKVDERVLIPRPETEIIVETICKKFKTSKDLSLKILDLGTGSGAISIVLAKNFKNASITALDCSAEALSLAEENAKSYSAQKQITFICGDMFNFLQREINSSDQFDIIVSNPPYIKTKDLATLPIDVQKEPLQALDGGEDGLDFYKAIIRDGGHMLKNDGYMFFEIGDNQAQDVINIFKGSSSFKNIEILKDYCNTERIIYASTENHMSKV